MNTKLFSVKAFQWEEKTDLKVMKLNEASEDTTKPSLSHYIRHLTIVGKHLAFQEAKKMRKNFEEKNIKAFIFPDIKEEELKVIKLS